MLILTRKQNEALTLDLPNGEQVRVVVVEIRGTRVRLGIDAPADMPVVREELLEQQESEAAESEVANAHAV